MGSRRIRRRVAAVLGFCLLAVVGFSLWLRHDLRHLRFNFSQNSEADVQPIIKAIKGTLASVAVIKQPGSPSLFTKSAAYSSKDLEADARLFDAWSTAEELGNAALEHTPSGSWVHSSTDTAYVLPEKRLDPWNHPYCLLRRGDILVVMSAGSAAPSSPNCQNIHVEAAELERLPQGKLLESPGGSLILALRRGQGAGGFEHH
jgi:hypothetical protein